MITEFVFSAYRILPPGLRLAVKRIAGTAGHKESRLDSLIAKRDAAGKKRLDRAIAELSTNLKKAEVNTVNGLSCMELGTGYVLSDALAMLCLGAKSVDTYDLNRLVNISATQRAISLSDLDNVYSYAFHNAVAVRKLLDACLAAAKPEDLKVNGLTYVAPHNFSSNPPTKKYDLQYSVSVLEHVPPLHLPDLMAAMKNSLRLGGVSLHYIDLKDHKDIDGDPFEFLGKNSRYDATRDSDTRGNRLTISDWTELFSKCFPDKYQIVLTERRDEALVPEALAQKFVGQKRSDLSVSGILVRCYR